MRFYHYNYFHAVCLVFIFWACSIDFQLGTLYGLANIPIIFFTSNWLLKRAKFPQVFLVSFYAIWVFHFPRALFLIANPDRFLYPIDGEIGYAEHFDALSHIFLYAIIWGIVLVGFFYSKKINIQQIDLKTDRFFARRQVVLFAAFFMMLFVFFMQLGSKLVGPGLAYMYELSKLILPVVYLLPISIILVFVFKNDLSWLEKGIVYFIILLTVLGALLNGSKAVLLNLALFVFFGKIISEARFKISLPQFLFLVFLVGIPIISSVLLMQIIRIQIKLFGTVNVSNLSDFISANIDNPVFLFNALDNFTSRLNGYDGLMMVGIDQNSEILNVFSANNLIKSYLNKLVPFISNDSISLGVGVGRYYSELPIWFKHAGALGGLGTMRLFFLNFGYLGIIVASVVYSVIIRVVFFLVKDKSLFFVFLLLWFSSITLFFNSGNIDSIAQGLSIWLIHLTFYYLSLLIIWSFLKSLTKNNLTIKTK